MKHCGMDVHLQSTTAEVLDPRTGEIRHRVVATERGALKRWLASEARMRVVLEAGRSSHWVAELAEECGHEVVVVDPNRTKAVAVAGGHKKTDRLDAATLAWLSTRDALVASHRARAEDRRRRRTLTLRQRLVRCRGDLVRAVRAALAAEGIRIRGSKPRGFSGAVKNVLADDATSGVLARVLEVIDVVEENIDECDRLVDREAESDPIVKLLMTADGVGPVVGSAFRVAVGTPERFRSGREVAAYFGLTPTVYNSGESQNRLGHISRHGDRLVRSLLVQAAHTMLGARRKPSDLRAWGMRTTARVGKKKAVVALARKLSVVLWAMWKHNRPFIRTIGVRTAPVS